MAMGFGGDWIWNAPPPPPCRCDKMRVMTQRDIEDLHHSAAMMDMDLVAVMVHPDTLAAYNKATKSKEKIVLSGSPRGTGPDLRRQWTVQGEVELLPDDRVLPGVVLPIYAEFVLPKV